MSHAASHLEQTRIGQGHLVCLGLAALVLVNLSLALFDTPPLVDWPNHLMRHILQCGAGGAANIAPYYVYDFTVVPNLSSELLHTLPIACIDPALTQKVLIQVSCIGLVVSTVLLHRAVWQVWSVWPLVSGLIAHHMAWAYGFENFILAAPFTLLALALWFRLERHGPLVSLLALWPVAVAIYVLHLYAFGFLMMVVGLLELQRLTEDRPRAARLRRGGLSLALLGLISAGPAVHLAISIMNAPEIEAGSVLYIGFSGLLMTVLSPFASVGNVLDANEMIFVALAQLGGVAGLLIACRAMGIEVSLDRRVRFAAPLLIGITIMVPFVFSDVAFTNIRFPVLLAGLMIAATRIRLTERASVLILSVVITVFAVKVGWMATHWAEHEAEVAELRTAAEALTAGDRLLVGRDGLDNTVRRHSHSASYLVLDRGLYWAGLFTGGNSLEPSPDYAAQDHTQPFPLPWDLLLTERGDAPETFEAPHYLHAWETFYTHVLILRPRDTTAPDASALGPRLAAGSFFDLYELDLK